MTLAVAAALVAAVALACGAKPGERLTERLVYSVEAGSGSAYAGIHIVDAEGGHRFRLTRAPPPAARNAEWSPSGDAILFATDTDFGGEIWTMGPDGSQARKIGDGFDASWSPDGSEVAILKLVGEIDLVTADGVPERTIRLGIGVDEVGQAAPAWSPDGRELAVGVEGRGIYVVAANGEEPPRTLNPLGDEGYDQVPVWAPDGKRIALFGRSAGGDGEAWIMWANGPPHPRLVAGGLDAVAWSFDGKSLLAESWSSEDREDGTYRYPLDRDRATRLGDVGRGLLESGGRFTHRLNLNVSLGMSWAADGQWLAYADEHYQLTVSRPDGSGKRLLTAPSHEYDPNWSPDGTRIAFARDGEVYVIGVDGKRERRIARGGSAQWSPDGTALLVSGSVVSLDPVRVQRVAASESAAWSPDGTMIAFVRYGLTGAGVEQSVSKSTLYTIHRDGTGLRLIAENSPGTPEFGAPVWTPDGRSILVAESDPNGTGKARLRRIAVEGGDDAVIAAGRNDAGSNQDFSYFSVSPDGAHLVFVSARGIETMPLTGGQRKIIVPTDVNEAHGLAWSPDGRKVAYLLVSLRPNDREASALWVVNRDGSGRRRVSEPREPVGDFDWAPLPESSDAPGQVDIILFRSLGGPNASPGSSASDADSHQGASVSPRLSG